jgi:drug/metabolite transporter (DMT)-like permease
VLCNGEQLSKGLVSAVALMLGGALLLSLPAGAEPAAGPAGGNTTAAGVGLGATEAGSAGAAASFLLVAGLTLSQGLAQVGYAFAGKSETTVSVMSANVAGYAAVVGLAAALRLAHCFSGAGCEFGGSATFFMTVGAHVIVSFALLAFVMLLRLGDVAVASTLVGLHTVVPVAGSVALLGESLSLPSALGVLLCLAATAALGAPCLAARQRPAQLQPAAVRARLQAEALEAEWQPGISGSKSHDGRLRAGQACWASDQP